jgi:hypothetical protein
MQDIRFHAPTIGWFVAVICIAIAIGNIATWPWGLLAFGIGTAIYTLALIEE